MFSVIKSHQKKIAIILITVILGSGLYYVVRSDIDIDEFITEISLENIVFKEGISLKMSMENTTFYKDEMIPIIITISIDDTITHIDNIRMNISQNNRRASQRVLINETLQPGNHDLQIKLYPYFAINGFIALNYGDYVFTGYELSYKQNQEDNILTGVMDKKITVVEWPVVDGLQNVQWLVKESNASTSIEYTPQTSIIINSNNENGMVNIQSSIQTTAYTKIEFNITGIINSSIEMRVNGTGGVIDQNITQLAIGSFQGEQNFSISIDIIDFENITIDIIMLTQRIPIFIVSANNNWDGVSTDTLNFELPLYYINQISNRYLNTFNITFTQVKIVDFETTTDTDLFDLIEDANRAVGKALDLNGSTWVTGPGPQKGNMGIDIELVFTNKTMDHLGIVIGAGGEAYNIAVNARGSNFEGNFRIGSSMADNLLQHEMSHIFGAPDRWTYSDEPSIMSKSDPNDAFFDIALGRFWLLQITWLEIDIQTMILKAQKFLFTI